VYENPGLQRGMFEQSLKCWPPVRVRQSDREDGPHGVGYRHDQRRTRSDDTTPSALSANGPGIHRGASSTTTMVSSSRITTRRPTGSATMLAVTTNPLPPRLPF